MDDFERALARGLGTWPGGTVFLAAVSGGADSTAMLAALSSLRGGGGFSLRCLHVDHGLRSREECQADAGAVRSLCESLSVPLKIVSIPPGRVAETARRLKLGIEGAARLYRRRIWNREARLSGAAMVLTAHTRDDLLETTLMRALRGSGPAGLAGIAPRRGRVLRPLLALGRAEVLGYLERRGLSYRIDSTNADIRYLRNRIRHKLIPLLDEWFPRWKKSLLLMAETQGLCAEFLEEAAENLIPWEEAGPPGSFRTEKAAFFAAPAIIREEALLRGADLLAAGKRAGDRAFMPDAAPRAPRPPRRGAIRRFVRGGASSADLGPLRLEGRGDFLTVSASGAFRGEAGFSLLIKEPGIYKLEGLRFRVSAPEAGAFPGAEGFYARLPLILRPRRREDRIFHPEGGRSGGARDQGGAITAEDSGGAAAFIGPGKAGVLVRREGDRGGNGGGMFFFTVSAGDTGERMGDSDV